MRYLTHYLLLLISLILLPQPAFSAGNEALIRESRQLQLEAVSLLFDSYYTEQSILFPEYDLITLQFNQEYGAQMLLQRLEIFLDGTKVSELHYNFGDIERLMNGAHQRLFATLLPVGSHTLKARLHGIGFRNGPYIEGDTTIEKGAIPLQLHMRVQGARLEFIQW